MSRVHEYIVIAGCGHICHYGFRECCYCFGWVMPGCIYCAVCAERPLVLAQDKESPERGEAREGRAE